MDIEDLVVRHAGWIRKKAASLYADRQDAEDLASETIYKCLSEGHRFDTDRNFKPWAYTILINTYKVQYNRRKCVLFTGYDMMEHAVDRILSDHGVIMRDMLDAIRGCLRESCCVRCVLLYAKGYGYSEIAEMTGIPLGTVKSRISTGRMMLRKAFEA